VKGDSLVTSRFQPSHEVQAIRREIDHPVIDADGHFVVFRPLLDDLLAEIGGPRMPDRLAEFHATRQSGRDGFLPARAYFGAPSTNTLDRATATLPRLMYERLDELGIDFALLYPTGLAYLACPDDELRVATTRAMNEYSARMYADYRDRLEPVAMIPTFNPTEALEELDHAASLGLRTVVMNGVIPRARRSDDDPRPWLDTLGHGSAHDYDPVWARCLELGIVPAFHGVGYGWGTRASATNFVFNHLGNFGAAQESVCRSLVMGGAAKRFSRLPFTFLEGGVSWAVQLYADMLGHYAKRNRHVIDQFDPMNLDPEEAEQLFREFGDGPLAPYQDSYDPATAFARRPGVKPGESTDDYEESGIESPDDIADMFCRQFYFGCEADDPMNALAFDRRLVPGGRSLRAMFASDISHWDVPDMRGVLPEAWELVEDGLLDHGQFEAFTFGNVASMLTAVKPDFFDGTAIEGAVRTGAA
jgi:predicted TIM-barrel fold metal-dependent hydrolase